MKTPTSLLLAGGFLGSLCHATDLNNDGLADLWQQQYSAFNLLPGDDTDGDGFTNAEESDAGTNPFDSADYPKLEASVLDPANPPLEFTFPTKPGKQYQLGESTTLQIFNPFGPLLTGDGAPMMIALDPASTSSHSGHVLQQFWANVPGNELANLTSLPTFPELPDGETRLVDLTTKPVAGSNFGFRLLTLITPPTTGDFSFFLSSGSSAQLFLSTNDDSANHTLLAQVLSGQSITPNSWDTFESQRSIPISLTAGQSYLLEVHALAASPNSHCQIAWTGPTLSGTEIITSQHLAPQSFLPSPLSPNTLFEDDYETSLSPLWPNSTLINGPAGMSGLAELITADPGNSSAETLTLPSATTDHLYFRTLVSLGTTNNNLALYLQGPSSNEEGPRLDLDLRSGLPAIRAGGNNGNTEHIFVNYDQTYRIEVIAALNTPFTYPIELTQRTVQPDTFDYYVSHPDGTLLGYHRGLTFRDGGSDIVNTIDRLRLANSSNPHVTFDDWHFTAGSIDGQGYLDSNLSSPPTLAAKHFFRLNISDSDQDNDGLLDSDELLLAAHSPFLFFDAESTDGTTDLSAATSLLNNSTGTIEISLQASDTAAFEDNSPNLGDDHGAIILTRTGPLTAVTAKLCIAPLENTGNTATICNGLCCTLIGSAGDEEAEPSDYTLIDEDGNPITDSVSFAFGEMTKTLTVIATPDTENEYPETLNLALYPDPAYTISSTTNGASIQLFDLPDSPANYAIFTGIFSQDGNAVVPTNGSGSTTAILNGPRTQLLLTSEFTGLTSNQQDAHIHKSNPGTLPADRVGPIIYAITNVPGAEGDNPPASDPLLGALNNYEWDLTDSSGAVPTSGGSATKQAIIDSLFGQNGETPLYFNIHTVSNPAGEIWSFLGITGGSITDPGAPTPAALAGSAEYPQLTGDALDSEVRRFLDQATFGATEDDVTNLLTSIETERLSDPTYHRNTAFEAWLDSQIALPQTYLVDYHLALDFQQVKLRGWFDPTLNPSAGGVTTPTEPTTWPNVDRSTNPDPTKWHLDSAYPVNQTHEGLAALNGIGGTPGNNNRRNAVWQMMVNAPDQVRQKMGFALQQIVLVSVAANTIRNSPYAASNYQDMLNTFAFSHYRDVLGFANWNPIMGRWLSSLQNQKGIDVDGDGINDTSPDENLARENMQLFSIGLFELWPDGTLRLGTDGAPNNTYTNEDIREFAKVITGQTFAVRDAKSTGWGGIPYDNITPNDDFDLGQGDSNIYGAKYIYPMLMFGDYHDRSIKTFAGTTIDNTHLTDPSAQGIADIEDALDWLAGKPDDGNPDFDMVHSHGSTPAFICLRLIQRLVKSNPSRDYLHRVATTFKDSEGDLALTLKAILLDPEARVIDLNDPSAGMKKSPLESFIQLLRNLDCFTYIPITDNLTQYPFSTAPGDFSNPDLFLSNFGYPASHSNHRLNQRLVMNSTLSGTTSSLMMEPFYQDTVFNWYLPDFAPSGPIANAGLVAPEMQLANEQDLVRNINYERSLIVNSFGVNGASIASNGTAQTLAFNGDTSTTSHDNVRPDLVKITAEIYPATPPPPTANETSEYLANLQMLDALDRRLTYGNLKRLYPIDPSDDGTDGINQNPRELILSALTYGGNNPWDGNNDLNNRQDRVEDALYLLIASPEFQVRK
ncbi:MAG: DUF1800 family protein [Verrucomicrobiota bacterium]